MLQSGSEVGPKWSSHLALKMVKPRTVIFPWSRKANDMALASAIPLYQFNPLARLATRHTLPFENLAGRECILNGRTAVRRCQAAHVMKWLPWNFCRVSVEA